MFDLRPVVFMIGLLLAILAVAMGVPALVDLVHGDSDWRVFTAAAAVTLFLALLLMAGNRTERQGEMSVRQIFLLTVLGWLVLALAAALPFVFCRLHLSPIDAVFEAMSGLTTTGATVLRGLDVAPPGILLWRGLLQWLGGMGFLVMSIVVLPVLDIGGMQIFRLESLDLGERVMPRSTRVALGVTVIYVSLTVFLTLALWAAGMSRFPALIHAMTTISCGGFSTSDGSIGAWHTPAIDWVVLVGMLMGGAPFVVYLELCEQHWQMARRNRQLRLYLKIFLLASLAIALWLIIEQDAKPLPALRHAAFTVASVLTGSGFATWDWGNWAGMPMVLLFFLTFVGGCAGSTAGGIKIFRFQILFANAKSQLARLLHPHAVVIPRYDKKTIPDALAEAVLGFLFVYSLSFALFALALGMVGLDFWSALSAAAAALANLGPGLTPSTGPMAGYGALPDAAKGILALAMLCGRLEMFPLLAVFARAFWRP